jgi:glycosyltransferase involved in cell wall biosynthesis
MEKPKVSFLIGVFNEGDRIDRCLKSIENQTYSNFEVVIIDDGSTDSTAEKIKEFAGGVNFDIKVVENKKNIGLTKSLNKGITHCSGGYIARLDADDIARPDRLAKQVYFLESNPDFALVSSFNQVRHRDGSLHVKKFDVDPKKIRENLIKGCYFTHSSILVRFSVLRDLKYNEMYKTSQDYELYVRIAKNWNIGAIPEPLVESEVRYDSISKSKSKWERFKRFTSIRWKAFRSLDYPWWCIIYVGRGLYDLILPRFLSSFVNKFRKI